MAKEAGGRPRLPPEDRKEISRRLATWLMAHGHGKPRLRPRRGRHRHRQREGFAAALVRLTEGAVPARTAEGWFHREEPKVPETPHLITLARKLPGLSLDWLLLHQSRLVGLERPELGPELAALLRNLLPPVREHTISEEQQAKLAKRVRKLIERLGRKADEEALHDWERRGLHEPPKD